MQVIILPSLLAADMGHLEDAARNAQSSGADALHLDIMDGHFVPNLSMGPAVVQMARKAVAIPLNVHLMLSHPDRYVDVFRQAGATGLLIHVEAECDVRRTLKTIRDSGMMPGLTLNPQTPPEQVVPFLDLVDQVLCMTVNPGYGGQQFMPEVLPKIRAIRESAIVQGIKDLDIMVDGGIDVETARMCASYGANAFVAGTSIFKAADMREQIYLMRQAASKALAA